MDYTPLTIQNKTNQDTIHTEYSTSPEPDMEATSAFSSSSLMLGRSHQTSPAPSSSASHPFSSATISIKNDSYHPTSKTPNSNSHGDFQFPEIYHFRPFFTIQPTSLTRSAQLFKWSSLILSYCRFHRLFRVSLTQSLCNGPLFYNAEIRKRLKPDDIVAVLDWMTTTEGGSRCEWIKKDGKKPHSEAAVREAWIWWQYPSDWADEILAWVEETGQKGVVFTVWELREGESTSQQSFHALNAEIMQRALAILVKKGKAQVFGGEGEEGIKFF